MLQKNSSDLNDVFLGLGSNIGELIPNLNRAYDQIIQKAGPVVKESALYKTDPWGRTDQDHFINQVILIRTPLSPWALIDVLKKIEISLNTEKREHWGPRTIDLDIIYYGQKIIFENDLIIPHPFMYFRNFVLVPLADIAPDMVHPLNGMRSEELLINCDDNSSVIRLGMLDQLLVKQ